MKRLITNLQNIWKVEELRKRILLTLGLILTYRVGSYVILPGVKYDALASNATDQNFLESILSVFSGGGFTNASIMALGIMPLHQCIDHHAITWYGSPCCAKNAK